MDFQNSLDRAALWQDAKNYHTLRASQHLSLATSGANRRIAPFVGASGRLDKRKVGDSAMMFWIISTGLSAVVAAFFLAVMRAQSAQPDTTAPALLIYTQQLQEVEKDVAKGLLAAEEALKH